MSIYFKALNAISEKFYKTLKAKFRTFKKYFHRKDETKKIKIKFLGTLKTGKFSILY